MSYTQREYFIFYQHSSFDDWVFLGQIFGEEIAEGFCENMLRIYPERHDYFKIVHGREHKLVRDPDRKLRLSRCG